MQLAGDIIIIIGVFLMFFGVIGIFRFKNFYAKILVSGVIDTVGAITFIIGIALKHGFGFFSIRLVLLIIIIVIINPLIAHIVARSAYLSGFNDSGSQNKNIEEEL